MENENPRQTTSPQGIDFVKNNNVNELCRLNDIVILQYSLHLEDTYQESIQQRFGNYLSKYLSAIISYKFSTQTKALIDLIK